MRQSGCYYDVCHIVAVCVSHIVIVCLCALALVRCLNSLHYFVMQVAYLQGVAIIIEYFTQSVKKFILLQYVANRLLAHLPEINCMKYFTVLHAACAHCSKCPKYAARHLNNFGTLPATYLV